MIQKNIPLRARIRKTGSTHIITIPASYIQNGLLKANTLYNITFTALDTSPTKQKSEATINESQPKASTNQEATT